MAIGDKYYRKYLALERCGIAQQEVAVVSQSSTDDDCHGASSNSSTSFGNWKSLLQERYIPNLYPHCMNLSTL